MNGTYGGNSTILFILFACTRDGQEKHDYPRNADFRPHFQVNRTNAGVKRGAHKYIIYKVARHAHLFAASDGPEVGPKGYGEAPDHGNGHDVAVVVDDFCEAEDVIVVEDCSSNEGKVDREESIAVVHESFVTKRWHGQALLHIARHDPSEKELVKNETGIHLPRIGVWAGILHEKEGEIIESQLGRPMERLTSRM